VHNLYAVQVIINSYVLFEKFVTDPHESIADFPPNYLSTPFSCCTFIQVCFLQKRHLSCSSEKFVSFFLHYMRATFSTYLTIPDLVNVVWWRTEVFKFLLEEFIADSWQFISVRSKYSHQAPVLRHR